MKNKKDELQKSKQGTGSAENRGGERSQQQNPKTDVSKRERQDIARDIEQESNSVIGLKDMGALSGRDDAAGGSGDRMEGENTGKPTDR